MEVIESENGKKRIYQKLKMNLGKSISPYFLLILIRNICVFILMRKNKQQLISQFSMTAGGNVILMRKINNSL